MVYGINNSSTTFQFIIARRGYIEKYVLECTTRKQSEGVFVLLFFANNNISHILPRREHRTLLV
jgi:hypothetical protein